jgi:hypothetical protein
MPTSIFPVVHRLNPAGWAHLLVYGLVLPVMVLRSRHKVLGPPGQPLPDRLQHFRRTTVELSVLTAGSLAVALAQRMELFPRAWPPWRGVIVGALAYATAVLCMRPRWRRAVERNLRAAHLFMPSNRTERGWWIAVSLLAGIGEEITWRGVQTGLLVAATGSYGIAALASALSFGGTHLVQGWRSAGVIGVFALAFQVIVWLCGSLYVAMAVHVLFDITAGLTYGRLGRQLGYGQPKHAPAV